LAGYSRLGLLHLAVLYTVWSTTYLAIRIAVDPARGGFPPFWMAGLRLVAAGALILGVAALGRRALRPSRADVVPLLGATVLLWIGGNGLVTWAETREESVYAALLVAATPIWTALIEAVLDRKLPSRRLALSLAIGFAGIAVLTGPRLWGAPLAGAGTLLALIVAPLSWGSGSVLQARRPVSLSPLASAGYQQLLGGVAMVVLSLAIHEPASQPSAEAWWAWGYLVVVGGLAVVSFVTALQLLPTRLVMTYAYVNPVGAAILGWLWLGERIDASTVIGAALVLWGVAGVFRERYAVEKPEGALLDLT
jgi:drug/metabolite transporter (DMT)-like permease